MLGALKSQANYVSNGSYSSNQWATEIYFQDANGANIGQFRTGHMTNGDELVEVFARRNVNGTDIFNAIRLIIASDGALSVYVTDPQAWKNALGIN